MGFNQRRIARERVAAERAERERRQCELGRETIHAEKLVAIWNSRAARKARRSGWAQPILACCSQRWALSPDARQPHELYQIVHCSCVEDH